MTIPKEYNHNTDPPTLMNPWDWQVEAEVKARFGIDKPRSPFNLARYMRAVAEVIQDHGTDLSFGALQYQVGDLADPRTRSGCHYVVVSDALNPDGKVNLDTVVIGSGATLAFCNAIKELMNVGALQVFRAGPCAGECPHCRRPTLHQYTKEPMCGCPPSARVVSVADALLEAAFSR